MNDLISREAAIEAVYQGLKKPSNDETLQRILDNLKQIPVIDYSQQWIPVSDGLPDKDNVISQWMIVTFELDGIRRTRISLYSSTYGFDVLEPGEIVVAWQPLPEPYKGELK